ncbi:MAG: polyprenol monophosphomannose synthase [Chloroflexi bacterium]|nr:polyprenol monophosphomannose synthase [Chloroflexota bacterium]
MKTIVVVPTYNEAGNLPQLADRLFAQGVPDMELLVVDDNSPDGTAAVAEALGARFSQKVYLLRRASKEGLGPAYLAGFREALRLGGEVVVQMDADLAHPPERIPGLLEALKGCDVVVASRYVAGGGVSPGWGASRRLLSRVGNLYVRWTLGLRVRDTNTGFKAYRREVLERLPVHKLRSKGFIFQAEVLYRCQQAGWRILEVPFVFHERQSGRSKMGFSILFEALWRCYQIRWT